MHNLICSWVISNEFNDNEMNIFFFGFLTRHPIYAIATMCRIHYRIFIIIVSKAIVGTAEHDKNIKTFMSGGSSVPKIIHCLFFVQRKMLKFQNKIGSSEKKTVYQNIFLVLHKKWNDKERKKRSCALFSEFIEPKKHPVSILYIDVGFDDIWKPKYQIFCLLFFLGMFTSCRSLLFKTF